ncbi:unnamed protein product [Nezara viridula]|uniref:EGF domain-specific O-linked N-acetylglucosamine transferase n=1 Tax=Nezara viridula TaxID=85310 RepID=A0A9P0E1G8_NEZVI|nr:unnamed protein product [Nezara viridula]
MISCRIFLVVLLSSIYSVSDSSNGNHYDNINLPKKHLPFFFSNFPQEAEKCKKDPSCPFKKYLGKNKCWGYEPNCKPENSFSRPACPGDHQGWVRSKFEQVNTFYKQGDFGYIKEQLEELQTICKPTVQGESSLKCSHHLRFCRGRNILINFTSLATRKDRIRYNMDVLSMGDITGYCKLDRGKLKNQCDHISPLQSWGPELRFFDESPFPIRRDQCDVFIDTPTYIMKIDATVNLYHHFCDFFNLYASQHVNNSHPDAFSTDKHILIWESYPYRSNFGETWKAFTRHPIWDLNTFSGKTVCFKNVVFPLLPRMIFGLFYNTPIIWGCEGSGLFKAFSQHILHRLGITTKARESGKLTITVLSRESSYRNILNEDQLIERLKEDKRFIVQRVVYNKGLTFEKQVQLTHDSDVFIGIHGAGLTHLLFLPDWAAIFELYNCEDENCYHDLARLRGVKYITWEKKELVFPQDEGHHPDGGAHAKFTNYRFEPEEFYRLVCVAADHVLYHPSYKKLAKPTHEEL